MIYKCEHYPELWVGHLKFLDGYLEVTEPADRRMIESSRLYGIHIQQVALSDGEEPANTEEQPDALHSGRVTRDTIGRQQNTRARRQADEKRSDAARAADGTEHAEQHQL